MISLGGCPCHNWKPSFLSRLIFNWCTFSGQVTSGWWRQWAKNQVLTNQNSRNRWCQIVRRTICYKKSCIRTLSRNHGNIVEQLKKKYGVILFRMLYHNILSALQTSNLEQLKHKNNKLMVMKWATSCKLRQATKTM